MDTRGKIIQSAVELFGKKGYHATSVQEISENAGVSKGALFYYFSNKGELLFIIHDIHIDILIEQAEQVLNSDGSACEKLRDLILHLVQLIADNKLYVTVFFQEFRCVDDPKHRAIIVEKRARCESIFRRAIEQGVKSGEFKEDLNIDITVKGIFGMCNWTYQWLDPAGNMTPKQIGLIFWDIIKGGMLNSNVQTK